MAARPDIDKRVEQLVSKGRWQVPGYQVRLHRHGYGTMNMPLTPPTGEVRQPLCALSDSSRKISIESLVYMHIEPQLPQDCHIHHQWPLTGDSVSQSSVLDYQCLDGFCEGLPQFDRLDLVLKSRADPPQRCTWVVIGDFSSLNGQLLDPPRLLVEMNRHSVSHRYTQSPFHNQQLLSSNLATAVLSSPAEQVRAILPSNRTAGDVSKCDVCFTSAYTLQPPFRAHPRPRPWAACLPRLPKSLNVKGKRIRGRGSSGDRLAILDLSTAAWCLSATEF